VIVREVRGSAARMMASSFPILAAKVIIIVQLEWCEHFANISLQYHSKPDRQLPFHGL
jgi:hypothetical protein